MIFLPDVQNSVLRRMSFSAGIYHGPCVSAVAYLGFSVVKCAPWYFFGGGRTGLVGKMQWNNWCLNKLPTKTAKVYWEQKLFGLSRQTLSRSRMCSLVIKYFRRDSFAPAAPGAIAPLCPPLVTPPCVYAGWAGGLAGFMRLPLTLHESGE